MNITLPKEVGPEGIDGARGDFLVRLRDGGPRNREDDPHLSRRCQKCPPITNLRPPAVWSRVPGNKEKLA